MNAEGKSYVFHVGPVLYRCRVLPPQMLTGYPFEMRIGSDEYWRRHNAGREWAEEILRLVKERENEKRSAEWERQQREAAVARAEALESENRDKLAELVERDAEIESLRLELRELRGWWRLRGEVT